MELSSNDQDLVRVSLASEVWKADFTTEPEFKDLLRMTTRVKVLPEYCNTTTQGQGQSKLEIVDIKPRVTITEIDLSSTVPPYINCGLTVGSGKPKKLGITIPEEVKPIRVDTAIYYAPYMPLFVTQGIPEKETHDFDYYQNQYPEFIDQLERYSPLSQYKPIREWGIDVIEEHVEQYRMILRHPYMIEDMSATQKLLHELELAEAKLNIIDEAEEVEVPSPEFGLPQIALDIITQSYGSSIVSSIASVQPIKEDSGLVYMRQDSPSILSVPTNEETEETSEAEKLNIFKDWTLKTTYGQIVPDGFVEELAAELERDIKKNSYELEPVFTKYQLNSLDVKPYIINTNFFGYKYLTIKCHETNSRFAYLNNQWTEIETFDTDVSPVNNYSKDERKKAKTANFALIYGGTGLTDSQETTVNKSSPVKIEGSVCMKCSGIVAGHGLDACYCE